MFQPKLLNYSNYCRLMRISCFECFHSELILIIMQDYLMNSRLWLMIKWFFFGVYHFEFYEMRNRVPCKNIWEIALLHLDRTNLDAKKLSLHESRCNKLVYYHIELIRIPEKSILRNYFAPNNNRMYGSRI